MHNLSSGRPDEPLHQMYVEFDDGSGFSVMACRQLPVVGSKSDLDCLATTVSWAGGHVIVRPVQPF